MIELLGNLSEHLGLPVNASSHGLMLDQMNGWVHWLMIILFVGWGIFFIVTLFKFGIMSSGKVDRDGVQSHASTYSEYAIIVVEAFLLVSFAIPLWSLTKTDIPDLKRLEPELFVPRLTQHPIEYSVESVSNAI